MKAYSKTLTFIHQFSRSVQCGFKITDQPPSPGGPFSPVLAWTGRPKKKHLPAYRQRILFVTQTISDRWQQRILYALSVAPNARSSGIFEPGRPPKLATTVNIGIPSFDP